MNIKDCLFWLCITMVIMVIYEYKNPPIPVVHWSTSQNECVRIMHDGVEMDCSELPEKYERVWVK